MQLHEFDEMNFKADKSVIAFNSRYVGKMMFVNNSSARRARVIGLKKYLSVDGRTPSSPAFTNRQSLSLSDMYIANSIIVLVKFDTAKSEDFLSVNALLDANSRSIYSL